MVLEMRRARREAVRPRLALSVDLASAESTIVHVTNVGAGPAFSISCILTVVPKDGARAGRLDDRRYESATLAPGQHANLVLFRPSLEDRSDRPPSLRELTEQYRCILLKGEMRDSFGGHAIDERLDISPHFPDTVIPPNRMKTLVKEITALRQAVEAIARRRPPQRRRLRWPRRE
jgi:hypothetical protein